MYGFVPFIRGDLPSEREKLQFDRIVQGDMDPTLLFEATTSRTILDSNRFDDMLQYHNINLVVLIKGF